MKKQFFKILNCKVLKLMYFRKSVNKFQEV